MAPQTGLQALTAAQARQCEAAIRLLGEGKPADALAVAHRLIGEAPHAADAHQVLAMCHAGAGNSGAAEAAFRRALELAPRHPLVLVNYATLLRKLGRLDEAKAALRQAVDAAPDSAKPWTDLGLTALAAGDRQQALAALDRAVALQPDSPLAWHALGNAYRADDQVEAAEAAFRNAVTLAPDLGSAWVNLGAVLRLLGRADEAIVCYESAGKRGYSEAALTDALTGALLDQGRFAEALEHARRSVREHPGFAAGHVTLANILWEHGHALAPGQDPVATFRAAARLRPQDRSLQLEFARFLLSARQADAALAEFRSLRAQSDHPALASMEADALEMLGRSDQAGGIYAALHRTAIGQQPAFLNAYARHLLRARQWDAAATCAGEATQQDPTNQEAWGYLGTAWRLMGDAREFWLCDYERLITLVAVEPPAGYPSLTGFLDGVGRSLEPLHQARREPVQQSLRGGSQTPGRLFGRKDPVLEALRVSLMQAVERWVRTLPTDASHPFLSRKSSALRFSGSWSVRLWSSGSHVNHIHPQGWMSSAFYVSLPPSVRRQGAEADHAGHIQFGQPPLELGLGLPPRRTVRPEPGWLALFPSCMWHGTVPFEDEQPRVTVAFDMVPLATGK